MVFRSFKYLKDYRVFFLSPYDEVISSNWNLRGVFRSLCTIDKKREFTYDRDPFVVFSTFLITFDM